MIDGSGHVVDLIGGEGDFGLCHRHFQGWSTFCDCVIKVYPSLCHIHLVLLFYQAPNCIVVALSGVFNNRSADLCRPGTDAEYE